MPVDVRCNMICSLGTVIRGQLSDSLMTQGGLITTTGTIEIEGINLPARGAEVQLAYHRPQNNTITRFPRRLRVLGATADPYRGITKVEVGCKLALQMDLRKRTDRYSAIPQLNAVNSYLTSETTGGGGTIESTWPPPAPTEGDVASYLETSPPIRAQAVLLDCLSKTSIQLATGARSLTFSFLEKDIDLSRGYLQVVDGLLKSEACFGYMTMDEKLMIERVDLSAGGNAAVLRDDDLIDLRPMEAAEEPADRVLVSY